MTTKTFTPPKAVAAAARKGRALRDRLPPSRRCCTSAGLAMGRRLAARTPLPERQLTRMVGYFARHEIDQQGEGWGKDSKGYQAWLLWGGDPGREWATKVLSRLEKRKAKQKQKQKKKKKSNPSKPRRNNPSDKIQRLVARAPQGFAFITAEDPLEEEREGILINSSGRAIGSIYLQPEYVSGFHGPCYDAWVVQLAKLDYNYRRRGLGTLLYLLAMMDSAPMSPDRLSVSLAAQRVWESLAAEDFFIAPFDDLDDPQTPPPEDDCTLHGIESLDATYTLSPAARKVLQPLMDRYEANARKMERQYGCSVEQWVEEANQISM